MFKIFFLLLNLRITFLRCLKFCPKSSRGLSVIIFALILGCSSGNDLFRSDSSLQVVYGNPTRDSIHFYTMGEMAFHHGDLLAAYGLFNQADLNDPENLSIKERILETLWLLGSEDHKRLEELVRLGADFVSRDLYTVDMLRYLGLAHFQIGEIENGLQTKKLALDMQPDPYAYYDYFLYLLRYGNRIDLSYLEKALEMSQDNPEMLYAIALIYEYHQPLKSKEILEIAADRFGDLESQEKLIDFYKRYRDWYSLVDFLEAELDNGKYLEQENRLLLLEVLFFIEDYERMIGNYHHFREKSEPGILELFFFAAYYAEQYDKAILFGERFLQIEDQPEKKKEIMLSSLAELYMMLNDYQSAVAHLLQVKDMGLITSVIISDYDRQEKKRDTDNLIEALIDNGFDNQRADYLKARLYLARDRTEDGLAIMQNLIKNNLKDPELLKSVAVVFLEHDDIQSATRTLDLIEEGDFEPFSFIASYYFVSGDDSLAIEYYTKVIESVETPSAEDFLSLASLLEKSNEHEKELQLMERAIVLHPDEPLILNWLGYTLVIRTDRYDEAEVYLLKALSLSPDNYYIQDSVAWLYYKLQDYEQALSYMQDVIANGAEDSVVAYHIGMIYYKLENKDFARDYLLKAVELNTDEEYTKKAEKVLKEIEIKHE